VASPLALAGLEVRDRVHVLVAESDEEFAAKITLLLGDRALRRSLAENARGFAVEHLSWEKRLGTYEELYASLVDPG